MFTVIKRMEISASHKLVLPYRSKCASLHGHNWIITVYCRSARLNSEGMVVDFTRIKEVVTEKLDHQNLNEVLPFNPTAENIARWVCKQIPQCYKVEVQESEGNIAVSYTHLTLPSNSSAASDVYKRQLPYRNSGHLRPFFRLQPEM